MTSERLSAVRERLAELGVDALYSVSPPDNQYLSGFTTDFEEISAGIIVTPADAILQTDSRYTEQAEVQAPNFAIEKIAAELLKRGGERLKALGPAKVAFDPERIMVAELDDLQSEFAGELVPVKGLLAPLRIRKSPEEIDEIRGASTLAEGVLRTILDDLKSGATERETAARIEFEFKAQGAQGAAFNTIALFGARSSLPHGVPGDRPLADGDIVLFDLGCRRHGYCSDLTRTCVFGSISAAWFEEIYAITLAAQRAAVEAVRPGARCRDVDAAARDIIKAGGYGDAFGHGVGHGVGIEIHEAPRVNPRSGATLEAGMVVTIEPGIYLPGQGGVRIEDLVVVTHDGCEVLTQLPKELQRLT